MKIRKFIPIALKTGAVLLTAALLLLLSLVIVNLAMVDATEEDISSHEAIPTMAEGEHFDYILVFGAGVRDDGSLTDMLRDRVIVGADLYLAGVADKIIMSGDRSGENYDEPTAMKSFAIELGVPAEDIICDFEGYSTHESLDRFERDYGDASVVLVSQEYHLHRALYVAKEQGIDDCTGVSADLDTYRKQAAYNFREYFARLKDLLFLN
ncbi:MAG: YdcF family protein [Clostridia bacterium]|nr:YdcF family protein [Clostridia bacterium]